MGFRSIQQHYPSKFSSYNQPRTKDQNIFNSVTTNLLHVQQESVLSFGACFGPIRSNRSPRNDDCIMPRVKTQIPRLQVLWLTAEWCLDSHVCFLTLWGVCFVLLSIRCHACFWAFFLFGANPFPKRVSQVHFQTPQTLSPVLASHMHSGNLIFRGVPSSHYCITTFSALNSINCKLVKPRTVEATRLLAPWCHLERVAPLRAETFRFPQWSRTGRIPLLKLAEYRSIELLSWKALS